MSAVLKFEIFRTHLKSWDRYLLLVLSLFLVQPGISQGQISKLEIQRQLYIDAERKITSTKWKDFNRLSKGLETYPLFPYLKQLAIIQNLRSVPEETVIDFLQQHQHLPIIFRLRRARLRELYRLGNWQLFNSYYQDGDGQAMTCRYAWSLHRSGQINQAWDQVKRLWLTGHSLPKSCDSVLLKWRKAGQLSQELAWHRAVLAIKAGQRSLLKYLRRFTSTTDQNLLNMWLQANANPAVVYDLMAAKNSHRSEILVREILIRLANKNLTEAMNLWQTLDSQHNFHPTIRSDIQESIGIRLAQAHRPEAQSWLNSNYIIKPSDSVMHWRLAIALWNHNWQQVKDIYAYLPTHLKQQSKWRYWLARAMRAQANNAADFILNKLSLERSYYGFLASDLNDRPYFFGHKALSVDEAITKQVLQRPEVVRCRELLALKRNTDARREWRNMLATLPRQYIDSAAQIARRWQWHPIVITTLIKSTNRNDLTLRFPLLYKKQIQKAAHNSGLSVSRIYSVIRQESAFFNKAQSSAGAHGLMQLLPTTARYVARKHRIKYSGLSSLNNPEQNLTLGSLYLSQLQHQFGNNPIVASAAYNAGPTRVRRWLPSDSMMPGDIWIENIPFSETREYVRRLLTYQLIYTHRLNLNSITISHWMPDIVKN